MNKWIFVAAIVFATSCGTNVHRNQKEMQTISENALQTAMENNPALIAGCVSIMSVSDSTQMASASLSRTGSQKDLTTTVSIPINGLAQTSALMYTPAYYVSFVVFYPFEEPKYTIGVTFFSSPAVSYAKAQSVAREIIEKTVYL